MKLGVIAVDCDGTIATHGAMHPAVRAAVGAALDAGIAVILATGDLGCFDVVVAENSAVLQVVQATASTN